MEVVRLLASLGADLTIPNDREVTPRELATERGRADISALIEASVAQSQTKLELYSGCSSSAKTRGEGGGRAKGKVGSVHEMFESDRPSPIRSPPAPMRMHATTITTSTSEDRGCIDSGDGEDFDLCCQFQPITNHLLIRLNQFKITTP